MDTTVRIRQFVSAGGTLAVRVGVSADAEVAAEEALRDVMLEVVLEFLLRVVAVVQVADLEALEGGVVAVVGVEVEGEGVGSDEAEEDWREEDGDELHFDGVWGLESRGWAFVGLMRLLDCELLVGDLGGNSCGFISQDHLEQSPHCTVRIAFMRCLISALESCSRHYGRVSEAGLRKYLIYETCTEKDERIESPTARIQLLRVYAPTVCAPTVNRICN